MIKHNNILKIMEFINIINIIVNIIINTIITIFIKNFINIAIANMANIKLELVMASKNKFIINLEFVEEFFITSNITIAINAMDYELLY